MQRSGNSARTQESQCESWILAQRWLSVPIVTLRCLAAERWQTFYKKS